MTLTEEEAKKQGEEKLKELEEASMEDRKIIERTLTTELKDGICA